MPPTDELISEYTREQKQQLEASLEDKLFHWAILQVAGEPWRKALCRGTDQYKINRGWVLPHKARSEAAVIMYSNF